MLRACGLLPRQLELLLVADAAVVMYVRYVFLQLIRKVRIDYID